MPVVVLNPTKPNAQKENYTTETALAIRLEKASPVRGAWEHLPDCDSRLRYYGWTVAIAVQQDARWIVVLLSPANSIAE